VKHSLAAIDKLHAPGFTPTGNFADGLEATIQSFQKMISNDGFTNENEKTVNTGVSRNWRKGWFLNPFCHLVIKAIRVDSHLLPATQSKSLTEHRLRHQMTLSKLAKQLGISFRHTQKLGARSDPKIMAKYSCAF
jgi:hypothetical protein